MPESPFAKAGDVFGQLSNQGLQRNSGLVQGEYLPHLRSGQRASKVWAEMGNDPTVAAVLRQIVMILRRVEWNVEAQTSDAADVERAEFIESCLHDMSVPWAQTVSDALSFLDRGFCVMEMVYKRRLGPGEKDPRKRSDSSDGRIGLRKLVRVPQDTVVDWEFDESGGVQGCVQQTPAGRCVIPIDKSLLFRSDYSSPWGQSILRPAYTPWFFKKRIEEIEAIWIERDLVGLPVAEVAAEILADPSRVAEWQNILRNCRADEQMGLLVPQQWDEQGNPAVKFYLLGSAGTRTIDLGAVVDRKVRDIAMSMLQDVLLLGHTRVGTQALASEKRDLSEVALSTWLDEIADVFNAHAVPRLLALNGLPLEDAPRVMPGDLRKSDVQQFAEAAKNLSAAGIDILAPGDGEVEDINFIRRYLGMNPIDPEAFEEAKLAEPTPPPMPAVPQGVAPPDGTLPDGSQVPAGQA
jgi:hypothetical protein